MAPWICERQVVEAAATCSLAVCGGLHGLWKMTNENRAARVAGDSAANTKINELTWSFRHMIMENLDIPDAFKEKFHQRSVHEDYVITDKSLGKGFAKHAQDVRVATKRHTEDQCLTSVADNICDYAETEYAVKVLNAPANTSVKELEDLKAEVNNYMKLEVDVSNYMKAGEYNPPIARLVGVYLEGSSVSLLMEKGTETLQSMMAKGLSLQDVAKATYQMLLAIRFLHSKNIVHRDLKPENFVYVKGELKLIDFGLSTVFEEGETMTTIRGNPKYMAPEVWKQSYEGGVCDMWSLGVIVFVLLAGVCPFQPSGPLICLEKKVMGRISPKSRLKVVTDRLETGLWPDLSDVPEDSDAKDFVEKLLEMDPKKRMTADQALKHPFITSAIEEAASPLGVETVPGQLPVGFRLQ